MNWSTYAQARHVTLVPEIEMPGHFLAALAAYPELSCTGGPFKVRTQWGIEPDVLCPGNDQAIEFAMNVLAEVTDLFPSPFIHIGGDEAPRDRWKACPKCQARMRSEGLQTEAQLQTYLNHRVEQFLASRGRRLIGWDEILEGGLTPGAVVMSWRGTEGGIAAANAGHDVVMSPTSHCYFDYAQSRGPGRAGGHWRIPPAGNGLRLRADSRGVAGGTAASHSRRAGQSVDGVHRDSREMPSILLIRGPWRWPKSPGHRQRPATSLISSAACRSTSSDWTNWTSIIANPMRPRVEGTV